MFASVLKDCLYLLSSLVTTLERVQVDEGEYLTSKSEITAAEEKTESLTITERDDLFVLLDVTPRGTPYVPPGIAKIPLYCFKNSFFVSCIFLYLKPFLFISVMLKGQDHIAAESVVSGVGTAEDMIREVVFEETKKVEETPSRVQEIPQQPVTDGDDDWFMMLDVIPRETTYVLPGIAISPLYCFKKCLSCIL